MKSSSSGKTGVKVKRTNPSKTCLNRNNNSKNSSTVEELTIQTMTVVYFTKFWIERKQYKKTRNSTICLRETVVSTIKALAV